MGKSSSFAEVSSHLFIKNQIPPLRLPLVATIVIVVILVYLKSEHLEPPPIRLNQKASNSIANPAH